MRELLVDSRSITDEAGRERVFDYTILVGEQDTGPFFCESYGVKIAERERDNASAVLDLTTSVARIDEIMELLLEQSVSPNHLADVISDCL